MRTSTARDSASPLVRAAAAQGLLSAPTPDRLREADRPDSPPPRGAKSSRTSRRYQRRALIADIAMLAVATGLVVVISPTVSPSGDVPNEPLVWSITFSALVALLFGLNGMYKPPLRPDTLDVLRAVLAQTALAATLTIVARVILTNQAYVSAETARHWLPAVVLLAAGRTALLWLESHARARGDGDRATLVVGAGIVGRRVARRLIEEPELGLRPVAFLDDDPREGDSVTAAIPVRPLSDDLEDLVSRHRISHVIVAFSTAGHDELLRVSRRCWELGLSLSVVPRLFEIEGGRVSTEHLGGLPLVELQPSDPRGWQFRVKYAIDRVVSAIALVVLAPLFAGAALAVLLSIGRPVLFRQRRVGIDGREFDMLKFRTLETSAEAGEADAEWAASQLGGRPIAGYVPMEGRITRAGRFLRRSAIDELPQLWNVCRGDMSLIGPRPERTAYVRQFSPDIYRYPERHRVKSGLTGWSQVNGLRGSTSLADRVEWDNHYIENWSLWMDFKILMRTLPAVFRYTWTTAD